MPNQTLLEAAGDISDGIIALRRAIHAEPELGLITPKTRDKIRAELADLPLLHVVFFLHPFVQRLGKFLLVLGLHREQRPPKVQHDRQPHAGQHWRAPEHGVLAGRGFLELEIGGPGLVGLRRRQSDNIRLTGQIHAESALRVGASTVSLAEPKNGKVYRHEIRNSL